MVFTGYSSVLNTEAVSCTVLALKLVQEFYWLEKLRYNMISNWTEKGWEEEWKGERKEKYIYLHLLIATRTRWPSYITFLLGCVCTANNNCDCSPGSHTFTSLSNLMCNCSNNHVEPAAQFKLKIQWTSLSESTFMTISIPLTSAY